MIVYKNGEYIKENTAPTLTAKYGLGFFETILYNGERLCHMKRHLNRLKSSLTEYGYEYPETDCEKAAAEIIKLNNLTDGEARVNIYAEINAEGKTELSITAQAYSGLKDSYTLNIYNRHQESHLNEHKSMNWAHFYLAFDRALKGGYDNALLVNRKNEIFEAATASLLLKNGDKFVTTPPANRLQGTALGIASEVIEIEEKQLYIWDLDNYENCFILNSLIGARTVSRVSVFTFESDNKTADNLSRLIREKG